MKKKQLKKSYFYFEKETPFEKETHFEKETTFGKETHLKKKHILKKQREGINLYTLVCPFVY